MPFLLDTSIIGKLIKYRLLDDALDVFKVPRSEIFILRETLYQLKDNKGKQGVALYTESELAAGLSFCDGLGIIKNIDRSVNNEEFNALTRRSELRHEGVTVRIDNGEALIFAHTQFLEDFLIWTADRKSLIALFMQVGCEKIHARIRGRVVCLEKIIRSLVEKKGFDFVLPRISRGHHSVDRAMQCGKDGCIASLRAAEEKLQADCNGLLIP